MPPTDYLTNIDRKTLIIAVATLVVGIILGVGFGLSFSASKKASEQVSSNATVTVNSPVKEDFYVYQSARATGIITKFNSSRLTLEKDDGTDAEFMISPSVRIYKYTSSNSPATVSSDVKSLEIDKEVLINLVSSDNNEYQVSTITFLPPDSPIPPTPATSSPSSIKR